MFSISIKIEFVDFHRIKILEQAYDLVLKIALGIPENGVPIL